MCPLPLDYNVSRVVAGHLSGTHIHVGLVRYAHIDGRYDILYVRGDLLSFSHRSDESRGSATQPLQLTTRRVIGHSRAVKVYLHDGNRGGIIGVVQSTVPLAAHSLRVYT